MGRGGDPARHLPFLGGFHDKPNTRRSARISPTGYIAPVRKEILDHNIVYEYRYELALGSLDEIRAAAMASRIDDTRPDYRFSHDRQHWTYGGVADTGFPIQGSLQLIRGASDPQLISPEQWWRADDVPKLYVRAAFRTSGNRAEIFWSVPDGGFLAMSGDSRSSVQIRMGSFIPMKSTSPRFRATTERSMVCGSTPPTRSAKARM